MGLAYDTFCLVEDIRDLCQEEHKSNPLAALILDMIAQAAVL